MVQNSQKWSKIGWSKVGKFRGISHGSMRLGKIARVRWGKRRCGTWKKFRGLTHKAGVSDEREMWDLEKFRILLIRGEV
jgi:hypothetical protein